jgi:LacI family transcriptional regulator
LLDRIPRDTAVICFQRRGYEVLLHLAASRGIRVPQDLSLCYFATSWEVLPTCYPVTTMRVPEPEMADAGVKILLDLIEGRHSEAYPRSFVGTLQEGLSTTSAPACPA